MIEVGKEYKLKKLDLPFIQNDESLYKVLSKRDNNVVCLNMDTNETYLFLVDCLIDPEKPEDDVFKDITLAEGLNCVIKPQSEWITHILEDGGCACGGTTGGTCGVASCGSGCICANTAAAISTGQSVGTSSGLGTTPTAPVGHIYGAMVNGKPVQGKSVGRKKKKNKKKNEVYLNNTNTIKLDFDEDKSIVYITIDNEECYTVDMDIFFEKISDYIYNEIDKDVFEFNVNWFDHFGKLNRYLKKVNAEKIELPITEELSDGIYVSPEEMIEIVQDTFEPKETYSTIVENNREKIQVTIKYTDPESKVLTHTIIKQWLDEADDVLEEEIIEDLSIQDCVDKLCVIFSDFGYISNEMEALENRLDKLLSESYDNEESKIELFERALELRNVFYTNEEMNNRTEAMITYLDLLESMKRNNILNDFVSYASTKNIDELSLDLIESTEDDYVIADTVAKRLERLGFIFADTKECIYKREGNYKHLIKYNNVDNELKYKVFDGDQVIDEQTYKINDKSDVNKVFDEIQQKVEGKE